MSRLILHVDLDAFFAAIEQRDHPDWRGRPVVVGAQPGQRGVVATCSYEACRFGVHSAMPIVQAARRLPPDTVYVRPRMADYAQVSARIMAVLGNTWERREGEGALLGKQKHRANTRSGGCAS